jgi:hypothetical protein
MGADEETQPIYRKVVPFDRRFLSLPEGRVQLDRNFSLLQRYTNLTNISRQLPQKSQCLSASRGE